ncbi:MAG TPA: hypothetical protein DCX27_15605, partial [Balneola sp.]|nr:hypothetical protein [Balneola sp.]
GQFAADSGVYGGQDEIWLTHTNGAYEAIFLSDASAISNPFSLRGNSAAQWSFNIDDIKLELVSVASDGEYYLLMYLNTSASNYGFGIYAYGSDTWSEAVTDGLRFNAVSTSAKPVFTCVDGVVRIADKLKGEDCYKPWFSYIDRNRCGTTTAYCRKWVAAQSPLIAPTDSNIPIAASASTQSPSQGEFKLGTDYSFSRNVSETGSWNPNGITGTSHASSSGLRKLVANASVFEASMVGMTVKMSSSTSVITGFESATTIYTEDVTWADGTAFKVYEVYDLGFSWVYDGNQESLIHNRTSAVNEDKKNWSFHIDEIACGHYWDTETTARKTGMQMYYRKNSDSTNTWYHLGEVDFNTGFRKSGEDDFSKTWIQRTLKTEYQLTDIEISTPPTYETYETRNGFKSDSTEHLDLSADSTGYSTSIIANRTHYIGNVKYANKDGVVRNHGDVMFKSLPNKFDTFPLNRKMEVSVQDGDEITALETYADRLLQFKKNKMHLINISQEIEFLEDTFNYKGVADQSAVCKTDYGVAWVNRDGCYIYNGKDVENLLEKNAIRRIKKNGIDGWVYNHTFDPMIAYLPKERWLFIPKDHSGGDAAAGAQGAWIYDMISKSLVLQDGEFTTEDGYKISNLVTDHNGDIVYFISTGVIKTLDVDAIANSGVKIYTRDIDFGSPGIRKKVYRVRISYKGDASALNVRWSRDGDDNPQNFEGTSSGKPTGTAAPTPLEDKSGDLTLWHHAELKPAIASDATNIYSFQLLISGTAAADFKINDISIIYREKTVK